MRHFDNNINPGLKLQSIDTGYQPANESSSLSNKLNQRELRFAYYCNYQNTSQKSDHKLTTRTVSTPSSLCANKWIFD